MRARWGSLPVRRRLIIAIAALVGATLLVSGVTLWFVESRRIDRHIDVEITREFDEFRAAFGATERVSADQRLDDYLARTLPEDGEILWTFPTSGGPKYIGTSDPNLMRSTAFARLVEDMRVHGGVRTFRSGGDQYRVGVLPLRQGNRSAALVVTHDRSMAQARLAELLTTYALAGLLCLVIVVAASSWLAGRLLSPLTRLRDTARDISAGSLDERLDVTGHDDLADLQTTFNDMLDRLESAFAAQRRMLDDAGHELRTPLTVLRGHLEVMSAEDPIDVAETRALLLDEIDRMSRLVDDLLVLAKARRPDFVRPEPVDLAALGDGILARCRGLADRDWRSAHDATGDALLDGQRVTQAMLQLADNAVRHTGPGDAITIGSARSGDVVTLWVADEGPGVPAELHESIFERFASTRPDEGFGLGLSIVRAIAHAHGGTASLDPSPPGAGAVFRLLLPTTQERLT